jgi:hypothetical protein
MVELLGIGKGAVVRPLGNSWILAPGLLVAVCHGPGGTVGSVGSGLDAFMTIYTGCTGHGSCRATGYQVSAFGGCSTCIMENAMEWIERTAYCLVSSP